MNRLREGLIILIVAGSLPSSGSAAKNPDDGAHQLVLDGVPCGQVVSFKGGAMAVEVIREATGGDPIVRKRPGRVVCGPATLEINFPPDKKIADWIAGTFEGKFQRKSGNVSFLDHQGIERQRWEFKDALLAEVEFPALDSASKEPAYLKLKLQPTFARLVPGSGKSAKTNLEREGERGLARNFRLDIAGLDCKKVKRIDPFTVRLQMRMLGDAKKSMGWDPVHLEFPDLKITLAQSGASSWMAWHEDFVINGNNGPNKEKSGSLVILSGNLQKELVRIGLSKMGILKLDNSESDPGSESIRYMSADLYCGRMVYSGKK